MINRILFIVLMLCVEITYGYGVDTHEELSKRIVPAGLDDYYSDILGFDENEVYEYIKENGDIQDEEWNGLIFFGSRREDDVKPIASVDRPLNHFFDPITYSAPSWGDNPTPDWALERDVNGNRIRLLGQNYSLSDAHDDLYYSLIEYDLNARKQFRQDYFYSLGHVLHLLADMGQPETEHGA